MTQPVIIKVYGNLTPASQGLAQSLQAATSCSMPEQEHDIISLQGDLLIISFEGIWFPLDETLEIIKRQQNQQQRGKLDYLDLEGWRLTRYIFRDGKIKQSSAPLNNVMAYSGH